MVCGGTDCPCCSSRRGKICPCNSLAAFRPMLAGAWHQSMHGSLTSWVVAAKSRKQVSRGALWTLKCAVLISTPAAAGTPRSSLQVDLPHHAVLHSSAAQAWWHCAACRHEWQATVQSREVSLHAPCPACGLGGKAADKASEPATACSMLDACAHRSTAHVSCHEMTQLPAQLQPGRLQLASLSDGALMLRRA